MSAVPATALPAPLQRLQKAYLQLPAEPAAMQNVRRGALERFIARGFPTPRDEKWKYTNLRRLEAQEFAMPERGVTQITSGITPGANADTYRLVFVDGFYHSALSTLPAQTGVRISPVSELLQTAPEELAQALDIQAHETCRFVALNTALTRDGALIDLAANTALDKPLQLSFIWSAHERSAMAHPRIIVRVGRHSKLVLLEEYSSAGETAQFTNGVTTLQLSEGAQVEHHRIQEENDASFHIGMMHAELAAHAVFTSHHFNLGAALARLDIHVFLNGAEAGVELNGLQFATGAQHHDTHTQTHHAVPNTRSTEDYRGIADERGRVVFNGKVIVHEKAVRTDARQSSRNLLLSRTAEIDTKPELEIYNDDVKCAHGATVGQLDANALFYLRSRGLDAAQARALLTQAFADAVISRANIPALREQLAEAVHMRFRAREES